MLRKTGVRWGAFLSAVRVPLRITALQQNTSQLLTFPQSPEPEITQAVPSVLKIPRKTAPKDNLDLFLGCSKATGLCKAGSGSAHISTFPGSQAGEVTEVRGRWDLGFQEGHALDAEAPFTFKKKKKAMKILKFDPF